MKEALIAEFEQTTTDLRTTISRFSLEEFNKIPFEGSWTPGQVTEHLWKSESGMAAVLKGKSEETKRDPLQHVATIRNVFLDYTIKLQSPEFIIPSEDEKNRDVFIKRFDETRKSLKTSLETQDLDKTFTDFSFPQMGNLTGWEIFHFVICHSKRHIRQLKNIAEKLKAIA